MAKQAPSLGRLLFAVGFALSCFGLILFLWVAFGGPIPLRPESYRITAYFPEATQLAQQADVRIGGVTVGKVESISLAPADERVNGKDTTAAVLQIDPEFAPISNDAKAILRQKTLLGETYVELTSGTEPDGHAAPVSLGSAVASSDATSKDIESIPEGGPLRISRTQDATQIDELFDALASQQDALAETFQILPTFQRESRLTLERLDEFQRNTDPLIRDLIPVAHELSPTLHSVRQLSPHLQRLFTNLDPLITASKKGLPALARFLHGLGPVMQQA